MIKAGVASTTIDPAIGTDLGGYPYFSRLNQGVHDSLYACALFLDACKPGMKYLIIATDLFYITSKQADRILANISAATGLAAEQIVVTCSHTHSAPWVSKMFENFPGVDDSYEAVIDTDYIDSFIDKISQTGIKAFENTFDAEIAFTKTICGKEQGIGGNRRDPENGPCDPDLPLLIVKEKNVGIKAIYTKYALHPTILHGENLLVSADYPGAIRKTVNESFPDAIFLFSQGTSGNQSPRYFRKGENFDEVERFGSEIGKAIVSAIPNAKFSDELKILYARTELPLIRKKYENLDARRKMVEHYRQNLRKTIERKASATDIQNADLFLLGAECEYRFAKMEDEKSIDEFFNSFKPFLMSALVLQDHAYIFLPGEIFVDYGLAIKQQSPYRETQVIEITNGDLPGYCVTAEALEEGGYEPWNSILDPKSGQVIVKEAVKLLKSLKEA